MEAYTSLIKEHLDIFVIQNEVEYEEGEEMPAEKQYWHQVMIHGDPEGLRSLAALLIKLADLDQDGVADLPVGAREHAYLNNRYPLSRSSDEVIVGRLDAKGTGIFYDRYMPRKLPRGRKSNSKRKRS